VKGRVQEGKGEEGCPPIGESVSASGLTEATETEFGAVLWAISHWEDFTFLRYNSYIKIINVRYLAKISVLLQSTDDASIHTRHTTVIPSIFTGARLH